MISLEIIESKIKEALKARDQIATDTLRGLKVRIQNEKIAKMKDLSEEEMVALVKSEIKRRKEASDSFIAGGKQEAADKEQQEAQLLQQFLPAQLSEQQLSELVDSVIAEGGFTASDFGKAMGQLKAKVGQAADGALMAKFLKEKLK